MSAYGLPPPKTVLGSQKRENGGVVEKAKIYCPYCNSDQETVPTGDGGQMCKGCGRILDTIVTMEDIFQAETTRIVGGS